MKVLDESTKFAHLGKPGTAFTPGFQRRLDMVARMISLQYKKILDMGTGEGVWLEAFARFTQGKNIFASEFDKDQVDILKKKGSIASILEIPSENIVNCPGEQLSFDDEFLDIVFHNEVLEHVQDDVKVLSECLRVLKPDGRLVFFTPNRGWPFEQHGMFFRGKYYWGNIPLLPWMPNFIYKRFAPHVKDYWWKDLRTKIELAGGIVEYHTRIYPGFDKLSRKYGVFGKFLKNFFHALEHTPLKFFGISHLVIVKKP